MITCPLYEDIQRLSEEIAPPSTKDDFARIGQLINRSTAEEQLDIQVIYACYYASELETKKRVRDVQAATIEGKIPYRGKVQGLGKGVKFVVEELPCTLQHYLHVYLEHLYNRRR